MQDGPAAQALDAWRAALRVAGCPERLLAVAVPATDAAGLVATAQAWAICSSSPSATASSLSPGQWPAGKVRARCSTPSSP